MIEIVDRLFSIRFLLTWAVIIGSICLVSALSGKHVEIKGRRFGISGQPLTRDHLTATCVLTTVLLAITQAIYG